MPVIEEPPPGAPAPLPSQYLLRHLTLRQLRMLAAIGECGSFSRAAESLHVSQPAVTKGVKEVETGLGQTLFVRSGRSVRATPFGTRLVELAQRLQAELQRGADELQALHGGNGGVVQVGATNVVLAELLPQALAEFKRLHPWVTVNVRTHALPVLNQEHRDGSIDLVLARVHASDQPRELVGQALRREPERMVMSVRHPMARLRHWRWSELHGAAWIGPVAGTQTRLRFDRLWAAQGLTPPPNQIVCGDAMLSFALLRRMPLLGIMPRSLALFVARHGHAKILPLEADLGLAELSVWHRREPLAPWVKAFLERLLEAAAQPAPQE